MRLSRVLLCGLLGACIAASALATILPANAAVYPPRQALSSETVRQFLADPSAWLAKFPNGGPAMITQVRDLAASDPATLKVLIGLLATANPDQASAIGTGLGQVAIMALQSDQAYAAQIQEQIVAAGNSNALVAYDAVVGGNIKLAATGPGGGGGIGGGGGPTGQSGITGGFIGGTPLNFPTAVSNIPDTFATLSLAGSTPGNPNTPLNVIQSVSPHH